MILKHQPRKRKQEARPRKGQIGRIPPEIGIVFPGSRNFSIYAISRSVPPDCEIGRNIWVGAKLLSIVKTNSLHASQILSRLINNNTHGRDAKINMENDDCEKYE